MQIRSMNDDIRKLEGLSDQEVHEELDKALKDRDVKDIMIIPTRRERRAHERHQAGSKNRMKPARRRPQS